MHFQCSDFHLFFHNFFNINIHLQERLYMFDKPAVHRAAWEGDVDLVKRLLDDGHDATQLVSYKPAFYDLSCLLFEDHRLSALGIAVHRDHRPVVQILAEHLNGQVVSMFYSIV